jgi:hypothetical protein
VDRAQSPAQQQVAVLGRTVEQRLRRQVAQEVGHGPQLLVLRATVCARGEMRFDLLTFGVVEG